MSDLSLEEFLASVNPSFKKYAEKLTENGLTDISELGMMKDEDFKYLSVPLFHWRQIIAKAKKLNEPSESPKENNSNNNSENNSNKSSVEGDPKEFETVSSSSKNKNPVVGWGTDEVELFIRTLEDGQYGEYASNFGKHSIDGAHLLGITGYKELKDVVSDLGSRYGIFAAIEELQDGNVPNISDLLKKDRMLKAKPKTNSQNNEKKFIESSDWSSTQDKSNKKKDIQNLHVKRKTESSVRQRLLKFYEIYNPKKLEDKDSIDELLRRYQGREQELFADLEQKYILSGPKTKFVSKAKRKALNTKKTSKTDVILDKLSELYHEGIRHVEKSFEFPEFHTPLLDRVDFISKPMVLLVGQYSVGKTSFIRYLVGRDFPGIRVGPEPTTDAFFAVMHGSEERLIPGHTVPMDRSKPFRTLQGFGAGFLNKFTCAEVPAPILESITFIDTPGILSGEKQRLGRNYEFAKVVEWFAYRADRILLLFDAHKLDISDEFKSSIMMLKGHDDKIRCVLNKADAVSNQQLLRVYGALMWSLGKVFKTPEVVRIYVGSFWDEPYKNEHNAELFDQESDDLLSDLRSLPRHCSTRKINEFVKRARQLKVHCLIIEHLRKQFGFFGKEKKQKKLLDNLKSEFRIIAKQNNLNLNDFPNPNKFKQLIQKFDISKFPKFKPKWREGIDKILSVEVPKLMRDLPSENDDENKESTYNPFANGPDREDADLDPTKKWAVSGTDKAKYDTKFYSLELQSGKASGSQVMNVMLQSGLSRDVLRSIWGLSDVDQDGKMDAEEFALCMYLIDMVKGGIKLPPTLPIALIPPGKRKLVEFN